jgi:hypothetical protein
MTFKAYYTEEDIRKSRHFHVWESDDPDEAIKDEILISNLLHANADGFFLECTDKLVSVEWVSFQ